MKTTPAIMTEDRYRKDFDMNHQYTAEERERIFEAYRRSVTDVADASRAVREAREALRTALEAEEEASEVRQVHQYWMDRAIMNPADEG